MQPGQNCTMKVDGCGSVAATGLQCDTCDELPPRCTRIRPFDPKIKVGKNATHIYIIFMIFFKRTYVHLFTRRAGICRLIGTHGWRPTTRFLWRKRNRTPASGWWRLIISRTPSPNNSMYFCVYLLIRTHIWCSERHRHAVPHCDRPIRFAVRRWTVPSFRCGSPHLKLAVFIYLYIFES